MKYFQSNQFVGLLSLALLLTSCAGSAKESTPTTGVKNDELTIWWEKGYYTQEDEALTAVITDWQDKTGIPVNFSFVSQDDILKNTESALSTGKPPDILFSNLTDETLAPEWAAAGKLADVSTVIEPLAETYTPTALQSAYFYNTVTAKRSAYAVPLKQQTTHMHYWSDLLGDANFSGDAIPAEWDAFWAFWKEAQDNLRAQGRTDVYAFGLPMSSESSDTHFAFEQVLDAYDVELWNEAGAAQLDSPQLRQGLIEALSWYTSLYTDDYVPPDATNWANGSNNTEFLNQNVLLVVNPTLSIPASQREDAAVYQTQIVTTGFPQEPDGERLRPLVSVKQVVLFEASGHKEDAQDLLAYLSQPDNLGPYLEGSLGRYFPVMPTVASEPFWNNPADPHISAATQQFQGETRSSAQSLKLASETVWGNAIEQILVDGMAVEEAADRALEKIADIFAE